MNHDPLGLFSHNSRPCDVPHCTGAALMKPSPGTYANYTGSTPNGPTIGQALSATRLCYFHTKRELGLFRGDKPYKPTAWQGLMEKASQEFKQLHRPG